MDDATDTGRRYWFYWAALKESKLSSYIKVTILCIMYTHNGNLI